MLNGKCVDTHCHLDLYPDPAHIVQEINRIGLHVIAVTNAPFVFQATQALAGDSGLIHPSIGLHPELVKSHGTQLSMLLERLQDIRFVGEVGLDYSEKIEHERRQQRKVFESILQKCQELGGKIVSIHSRRAVHDVIDMVGFGFRGTAILHWFAGTEKQLAAAHRNGLYFSINPAMVLSNSVVVLSSQCIQAGCLLKRMDRSSISTVKPPCRVMLRLSLSTWQIFGTRVRRK